jgi:hypothetical protein
VPPVRSDGLTGAPVPERTAQASSFDAGLVNAAAGTFPPLDFPIVVSGAEATWLLDEDIVLGAVQNGEARAYPLCMMTLHHVSNDRLGGEPYLVTFWIVCSSGVGFDPGINGQALKFQASGIYNGVFLMIDDVTGTVWSHLDGAAVAGELLGTQLEIRALQTTTWGSWLEEHPETTVPAVDTGYSYFRATVGRGGLSRTFLETLPALVERGQGLAGDRRAGGR